MIVLLAVELAAAAAASATIIASAAVGSVIFRASYVFLSHAMAEFISVHVIKT